MQVLATGVGDLKPFSAASNPAHLGEVALGNILEEILSADQFPECRSTAAAATAGRVRDQIAGRRQTPLWLPVDAKYPTEDYDRLVEATEQGDTRPPKQPCAASKLACAAPPRISAQIRRAAAQHRFCSHVLGRPRVISPSRTRPGLVDMLQREFHVMVAVRRRWCAADLAADGVPQLGDPAAFERGVESALGRVKNRIREIRRHPRQGPQKTEEAQQVVEAAGVRRRAMDKQLRSVEILAGGDATATPGARGKPRRLHRRHVPITVADALNSRMIAYPFRLLHVPRHDGGGP